MTHDMSSVLRALLPQALARFLRGIYAGKIGFHGRFRNWQQAQMASSGYGRPDILDKVRGTALRAKRGEIAYEQDGVAFLKPAPSYPALCGLLLAGANHKGEIRVLDFGGSLGSMYFRNRALLAQSPGLLWGIVEQPHFAAIGRTEFESDTLLFFDDIASCRQRTRPNIALLSGVLQYLEHPYRTIKEIKDTAVDFIVVDRTPFTDAAEDFVTVQTVPPSAQRVSYPSWIFSKSAFEAAFHPEYRVVSGFAAIDDILGDRNVRAQFRGMILSRSARDGLA